MAAEFTLDDAVTLLLQLEPEDRDDFARVREALADLAFGNLVPIAVQPLVARAVRVLKPLAEGTAADPAATFAEACALLEQAMGDDGISAAPKPAAAVAPTTPAAPAAPVVVATASPAGAPASAAPAPGAAPADAFDPARDLLPPTWTSSCCATSSWRAATASRGARRRCSPSSSAPTTARRSTRSSGPSTRSRAPRRSSGSRA
jgi:hypothetical protein